MIHPPTLIGALTEDWSFLPPMKNLDLNPTSYGEPYQRLHLIIDPETLSFGTPRFSDWSLGQHALGFPLWSPQGTLLGLEGKNEFGDPPFSMFRMDPLTGQKLWTFSSDTLQGDLKNPRSLEDTTWIMPWAEFEEGSQTLQIKSGDRDHLYQAQIDPRNRNNPKFKCST